MLTRALIVLLLVLNLGVAAWWWLRPSADAPAAVAIDPHVPRLQLVGEKRLAAQSRIRKHVSAARVAAIGSNIRTLAHIPVGGAL